MYNFLFAAYKFIFAAYNFISAYMIQPVSRKAFAQLIVEKYTLYLSLGTQSAVRTLSERRAETKNLFYL